MKHDKNPFNHTTYPAVTLDKKLSLIEHELKGKGLSDMAVFLIQAYLLCLGKGGYLKDGRGYERKEELYDSYLSKAANLRDLLAMSFIAESVKDFLQDSEDVLAQGDPSLFEDTFQKLLNNQVRSGQGQCDFMQSAELTDLTVFLSGYKPGMTIYNPYAGVASYASKLQAESRYFAEEKNPQIWALGVMRMLMNNCYSENYIIGDSLHSEWDGPFDVVISTPQLGYDRTAKKNYAEELIYNAGTLLSKGGRMVVIVPFNLLVRHSSRKLRTSNLLKTVITLPNRLMYWTSIPCAVLVFENREENDGITMVEGGSFFSPGGRITNTLDIKGLQDAMKRSDPTYVVKVSIEDIERNGFGLFPHFYLDTPKTPEPTVRLCELGTFLPLPLAKEKVQKGICIKDLCMGPDVNEVEPKILTKSTARFRKLEQSALLISAIRSGMKMGLVSADSDHPVFISEHIYAFAPDPKKADIRFIAQEIQKSDGRFIHGSSVFYIRKEELSAYPIPLLSLEEQQKAVKKSDGLLLSTMNVDSFITMGIGSDATKRTIVWVGPKPDDFPLDTLKIKREFSSGGKDMREWLKKNTDSLDAVIIYHAGTVRPPQISLICDIYSPVYVLSDHLDTLENELDGSVEDINDRCFQRGYEKELLERLERDIRDIETPEGQIRRRFAEQWKAIKNIDSRFPRKGKSLESLFMEVLLAAEDPEKNINGNTLRTMRDEYFLKKLEDYGLLPPSNKMTFTRGAQMSFIVDCIFTLKNDERCFVLNRELIPFPLNLMAKVTGEVLNRQSHEVVTMDKNLQWAIIHILLGLFCKMGEMIDQGLFDEDSKNKNRQYWTEFDPQEFESGKKRVCVRQDDYGKDYFYADNVHLKNERCRELEVKEGDFVYISDVRMEKHPIVEYNIVFYATSFSKI